MRVIYKSINKNTGAGWTITQDPTMAANNNLIRFHRTNGRRMDQIADQHLLNQIAEWDPSVQDWKRTRWFPRPPVVPQWLIDRVVAHMSFEVQP